MPHNAAKPSQKHIQPHFVASVQTRLRWMVIAGMVIMTAAAIGLYVHLNRTPGELLRYTEHRVEGHPKLEWLTTPVFQWLRPLIERPITEPVGMLGRGQQSQSLGAQRYDRAGRPVASKAVEGGQRHATPDPAWTQVHTDDELSKAISTARPGDIIDIAPGTYRMSRSIKITNSGSLDHPITVRAQVPGSVIIESTASEGFRLHAPYWIFENLVIRGICPIHSNCEHAFHIVGKAQNTVIRNNRIEDFNAHIKVNGLRPDWPDHGLIQFNTLTNHGKRQTGHPVTPIDIVAASAWQVLDNHISNFVKGDGNQISYGAFMKGGGQNGAIERNVFVCTNTDISQPGKRIGASLGGGGTDTASCRDQRCVTEHTGGKIHNNLIAHCNDFGIYVNKSNQTHITSNTLINTYGIDVRYPTSSALITNNALDGHIRQRDGAIASLSRNTTHVEHPPSAWQPQQAQDELNLNEP